MNFTLARRHTFYEAPRICTLGRFGDKSGQVVRSRHVASWDSSVRLFDDLWTQLVSAVNQIASAVSDSAYRPEVNENDNEGADWNSADADEHLERLEAFLRDAAPLPMSEVLEIEDEYSIEPPEDEHQLHSALTAMREAVRLRSKDNLRMLFDDLCGAWEVAGPYGLEHLLERAEHVITLLEVETPTLIYLPPPPRLYIPQFIVESNEKLIRQLSREPHGLYDISPRKFEEIIADIFWKAGYEVELTRQTRDGGRDIIALSQRMDIPIRLIIECKRYAPQNKVGLALVQRLFGVKLAESANKAILATTSAFTRDAKFFASHHIWDLDLKDHDAVVGWLRKYPNITA